MQKLGATGELNDTGHTHLISFQPKLKAYCCEVLFTMGLHVVAGQPQIKPGLSPAKAHAEVLACHM